MSHCRKSHSMAHMVKVSNTFYATVKSVIPKFDMRLFLMSRLKQNSGAYIPRELLTQMGIRISIIRGCCKLKGFSPQVAVWPHGAHFQENNINETVPVKISTHTFACN